MILPVPADCTLDIGDHKEEGTLFSLIHWQLPYIKTNVQLLGLILSCFHNPDYMTLTLIPHDIQLILLVTYTSYINIEIFKTVN